MKEPEGFSLYYDRLRPMKALPDVDLGKVFRAIWEYAEAGIVPDLPPHLMMAWEILRPNIDDGKVKYNEKCATNKYNRYRQEAKRKGIKPSDMWEWWAEQPSYSPELFKHEAWYDEAAAEHQRIDSTTVNDGQRPLQKVTNTSPYQSHSPGNNQSQGTGNNTPIGSNDGADRFKQLAEVMKRKNIEQRFQGQG